MRVAERFRHRPHGVPLDLEFEQGGSRSISAVGRNLSSSGMGLLAGQFIYPGTRSTVQLSTLHGGEQVIPGRVVRCRYLVKSGMLYDVGLEFDRAIDVALFAEHARLLRILLLHDSPATHELVAGFR